MPEADSTSLQVSDSGETASAAVVPDGASKVHMPAVKRASLFLIVICLSLIAIDAWRTWGDRAARLNEANTAMSNIARALARHANDTITVADAVMVGLVERVEVEGTGPAALERLRKLLAQQTRELSPLHGIFIYDANGDWLVNSIKPVEPGRYNNADREYFQHHRDNPSTKAYIGMPVISRSTDEWILPVSRRFNNADGSFGGVIMASISMDYFRIFYSGFDIGEDGAIVFGREDGTLLLRRPFNDDQIGQNLSKSPLFLLMKKNRNGSAVITAPLDGIERLYAYQHLENYPLSIAAALSKREILEVWLRDTWIHTGSVLLLTMVFAILGTRMISQFRLRALAQIELQEAQLALQDLNQTLEAHALQDGLTGLANRRRFDVALDEEFRRMHRTGGSLALILIDVDRFKQYNDLYGHPAGDQCLRSMGAVLRESVGRPGDLAARYGGEEMVVLLAGSGTVAAMAVAERIRLAVEALGIVHAGNPAGVATISAGIASVVPATEACTPLQLLERADKALYLAKAGGRNRVCASGD